ncbi:hypothetical protein ACPRNU_22125 [Chromobacterium vaccinii]|uniref:hypothetical protein n=1 Tax=Chromobacterium TaxID=535 RepID=UPI00130532D7|nr:hypothetical protein [Chromobacterium sp. ATCC 53434]
MMLHCNNTTVARKSRAGQDNVAVHNKLSGYSAKLFTTPSFHIHDNPAPVPTDMIADKIFCIATASTRRFDSRDRLVSGRAVTAIETRASSQ